MMSVQEITELQEKVQRGQYAASLTLGGITYFLARKAFKTWPWPVKILMFVLISNGYLTISEQVKQWYIKKKTEEAIASATQGLQQNIQDFAGKAQTLLSGLSLPFGGGGGAIDTAQVDETQIQMPDDSQVQPF